MAHHMHRAQPSTCLAAAEAAASAAGAEPGGTLSGAGAFAAWLSHRNWMSSSSSDCSTCLPEYRSIRDSASSRPPRAFQVYHQATLQMPAWLVRQCQEDNQAGSMRLGG